MVSRNLSRWSLLAGTSLLVLGSELYMSPPAAASCITLNSTETVVGSTGCVIWTGGNLYLTSNGALISSGTPAITAATPGGTLSNNGSVVGDKTIRVQTQSTY